MKKKIMLITITFSIPIIIISSIMIYLIQGPIKREFLSEHSLKFSQQSQFIHASLEQLELYIANWGAGLRDDHLIDYPRSLDNYQTVNSISERIFLLENISPLIEEATLAVYNDSPYYLNAGGTWQQSLDHQLPSIDSFDLDREFQWITYQQLDRTKLYFVQTLFRNEADGSSVFLLAEINLQKTALLLEASQENQSFQAYLIDGKSIAHSGQLTDDISNALSQVKLSESSKDSFQYRDYSVATSSYDYINQQWTFVSIVPISSLIQPIQSISTFLLISAFILIIGTIFYSYYFSRKEYEPVYNLIRDISGGADEWERFPNSTTDYLKQQWVDLQEERQLLLSKSSDAEKRNKRNIINRIIIGELSYYSEHDLKNKMKEVGWSYIDQGYHLFSIHLTETTEKCDSQNLINNDLSDFILNNVVNELAEKHFIEYTTIRSTPNCVYLFVSSLEQTDAMTDLFITDTYHYINRILKRYCTVVMSQRSLELKTIPDRYQTLSHNRYFHEMKAANQFMKSINNRLPIVSTIYPSHYERLIIDSMVNNNSSDLYVLTKQFIDTLIQQQNIQIYVIDSIKLLYNNISFFLIEHGVRPNDYISKESLVMQIDSHFNVQHLATQLHDSFILPAYTLYAKKADHSLKQEVMDLKAHLDKHFSDPDLSLDQSAEQLNIEPHLLSKNFKKFIGMNYVDYITTLRINHAKKLLIHSDLKINSIAETIGYNSSYFNRLFKRKLGLTPGQYRQENQSNQN